MTDLSKVASDEKLRLLSDVEDTLEERLNELDNISGEAIWHVESMIGRVIYEFEKGVEEGER